MHRIVRVSGGERRLYTENSESRVPNKSNVLIIETDHAREKGGVARL